MLHSLLFILSFSVAAPLNPTIAKSGETSQCKVFESAANGKNSSAKLNRFLKVQWAYLMHEFPEWATYAGFPGEDDRWSDLSLTAIARRKTETQCQLQILKKISRVGLNESEKISLDLALYELEMSIEGSQFGGEFLPVTHMENLQGTLSDILQIMPAGSVNDYNTILRRLERFPTLASQTEILMREGLKKRIMPVKAFMPKITRQLDEILTAKVEDSPLFAPFKELSPNLTEQEKQSIRSKSKEILAGQIFPALRSFREFFATEYAPHGRESIAWIDMPNGKAWYEYRIRQTTTTRRTADDLHETGLKEVSRLTAEMETLKARVKFSGDLKAFNQFLMTDKKFQYATADELIAQYRSIAKRMDPELTKLFRTLPRLTYGIRAMPEFKAKTAPGGMYTGGSLEAGRPGYFEDNTYDLASEPKWGMETLVLHEAVPGHHFQIALAKELDNLPDFRRNNGYTAFDEGWALYAETLGRDIGFYSDTYSEYGNLTGEMLRSVRLVVDTGMHAKGWTREKALAYYLEKIPTTEFSGANEIDRYITWPAQALAYKVGQMKIRSLRDSAQKSLADQFDLREFHDQVLRAGSLPLNVLEKNINLWIASKAKPPVVQRAKMSGTLTR